MLGKDFREPASCPAPPNSPRGVLPALCVCHNLVGGWDAKTLGLHSIFSEQRLPTNVQGACRGLDEFMTPVGKGAVDTKEDGERIRRQHFPSFPPATLLLAPFLPSGLSMVPGLTIRCPCSLPPAAGSRLPAGCPRLPRLQLQHGQTARGRVPKSDTRLLTLASPLTTG